MTKTSKLRKLLASAAILAALLGSIIPAPAQAAFTACATGDTVAVNCTISADLTCSQGYQVRLKVHTWDFGFADSTGDTILKITSGGKTYTKAYYNVEHDGTTRYFFTGKRSTTHSTATFNDLWTGGTAEFWTACVPI